MSEDSHRSIAPHHYFDAPGASLMCIGRTLYENEGDWLLLDRTEIGEMRERWDTRRSEQRIVKADPPYTFGKLLWA